MMKALMKLLKILILLSAFFISGILKAQIPNQYVVKIQTYAFPPVDPFVGLKFNIPPNHIGVSALFQTSNPQDTATSILARVFGKLERIFPEPFTIELSPSTTSTKPITLTKNFNFQLSNDDINSAFNYFNNFNQNLIVSGIILDSLKINGNIKLPEGQYRICFYVKSLGDIPGFLSDPQLGCAFFEVCKINPPQFTQPVNGSFAVQQDVFTIPAVSPVVFTWTPPQPACGPAGAISYELEIFEILNNQSVTDAINNPFVFRRPGILTNTFVLDLNLFREVLQKGKKYAIRVRATARSRSFNIDNFGYSRIEAFQFGNEEEITGVPPRDTLSYFLDYGNRQSKKLDDEYDAYTNNRGRDRNVPVAEFIAFRLMKSGIAYSRDAIRLILMLNPDLRLTDSVKLSTSIRTPDFPEMTTAQRQSADLEHQENLRADDKQIEQYRKLSDSLRRSDYRKRLPDNEADLTDGLLNDLRSFDLRLPAVNRVSLEMITSLLREMLILIRLPGNLSGNPSLRRYVMQISDIRDLTAPPLSTALQQYFDWGNRSSLSYFKVNPRDLISGYSSLIDIDQLLPADVIVFRAGALPAGPVLNKPDLFGTYRIFYTTRGNYVQKDPEGNASGPTRLASVVHVSLPPRPMLLFWTVNMRNRKSTRPVEIDMLDIFENSAKRWPNRSKPVVVLEVE